MTEAKQRVFKERFQAEKKETSYFVFYNTLSEAADALLKVYDPKGEYLGASIWKTPIADGGKYTVVKHKHRQIALDFGYGLVEEDGFAYDIKVKGKKRNDVHFRDEVYPQCDGTKSFVYQQYKELGLL